MAPSDKKTAFIMENAPDSFLKRLFFVVLNILKQKEGLRFCALHKI